MSLINSIKAVIKSKIIHFVWEFIRKYLFHPYPQDVKNWQDFFYKSFKALSFNGITGDYTEFGCCGGNTFPIAFYESKKYSIKRKFWAFDSFQGLPAQKCDEDSHPKWQEGMMAISLKGFKENCARRNVPSEAYETVVGFYEETLPKLSSTEEPTDIALVYIDCDLYSSTKTILEFLKPRLKHGMILAFDDYYCWSSTQISGERRAMLEFFKENDRWELQEFQKFGWHGNSFIVDDRKLL